jgi:hypothetical protein
LRCFLLTDLSQYNLLILLLFPSSQGEKLKIPFDPLAKARSVLHFITSSLPKDRQISSIYSFLLGKAGIVALDAVVSWSEGAQDVGLAKRQQLLAIGNDLINDRTLKENELIYGRVGYLYSLLFVDRHIPVTPKLSTEQIAKKIIRKILKDGYNFANALGMKNVSLVFPWSGQLYLGAAHGTAGILYILLHFTHFFSSSTLSLIKTAIDELQYARFKSSGNYQPDWDSTSKGDDYLVHWCHGAPGMVYLFLKAFIVFENSKYLTDACNAGDVIWERGLLKKGIGLCHGICGNGYAFLSLYKYTQDIKWYNRAIQFGSYSIHCKPTSVPDNPHSLFEGMAGAVCYHAHLLTPQNANFPAFE